MIQVTTVSSRSLAVAAISTIPWSVMVFFFVILWKGQIFCRSLLCTFIKRELFGKNMALVYKQVSGCFARLQKVHMYPKLSKNLCVVLALVVHILKLPLCKKDMQICEMFHILKKPLTCVCIFQGFRASC